MTDFILTPGEVKSALPGAFFSGELPPLTGAYTDSRQSGEGKLFIAVAGEKFDGHDFLEAAAQSAAAVCIDRRKRSAAAKVNIPVIAVDDTVAAYQALARSFRRKNPALKVVGVTGSVGKTSVKEMVRAILTEAAGEEQVLATLGNTNNHIGVPQNLFRLTPCHRFAVVEMGTSAPGEIAPLSCCAEPDAAIVNSIAPCHLENLGDLNGVAAEKGTIAAGLSPQGYGILPFEVAGKEILVRSFAGHPLLFFGADPGCDCRAEYLSGDVASSRFRLTLPDGKSWEIAWNLSGRHQALNAAAAAAAAWSLGIPGEVISAGLPHTVLPGMRMKKSVINGITYINDAYNANPASMRATLTQLADGGIDDRRLVLLLGGMRELGENSAAFHAEIMALARRLFPHARIITVGEEFSASPGDRHFAESGADVLTDCVQAGDWVFAKGSRGIALEKALPEGAR